MFNEDVIRMSFVQLIIMLLVAWLLGFGYGWFKHERLYPACEVETLTHQIESK